MSLTLRLLDLVSSQEMPFAFERTFEARFHRIELTGSASALEKRPLGM